MFVERKKLKKMLIVEKKSRFFWPKKMIEYFWSRIFLVEKNDREKCGSKNRHQRFFGRRKIIDFFVIF